MKNEEFYFLRIFLGFLFLAERAEKQSTQSIIA